MHRQVAQRAAIVQEELCVAILRGFRAQMLTDSRMRYDEVGLVTDYDGIMMDGVDEIRNVFQLWLFGTENVENCFTPRTCILRTFPMSRLILGLGLLRTCL